MSTTFNYPTTTESRLTAISVAYRNGDLIGSMIAPKVRVPANLFKYNKGNLQDGATIPETKVSVEGQTNEILFSQTKGTGEVIAHGLHTNISNEVVRESALTGFDVKRYKTIKLTETIVNREEVEISTAVQNAANYDSGYKATLSGATQFSEFATSDPVRTIMQIQDACNPSVWVMGPVGWYYVSRHTKLIQYLYGANATQGYVDKELLAQKMGFKKILVGGLKINTAEDGLTPAFSRTWANHMAFLQVDETVQDIQGAVGMFFNGYLPLDGMERKMVSSVLLPGKYGVEGGIRLDLLEKKQIIRTAGDLGYLLVDAVVNDWTTGD